MITGKNHISTHALQFLTLFTIIGGLTFSCRDSGSDVIPGQKKNDEFKKATISVQPDQTTVIDLQSRIDAYKSSTVAISLQPTFGVLTRLTASSLQYKSNTGVTSAVDFFRLAFFDDNKTLLAEDSLQVIIGTDTTATTCLIYANGDYVYNIHAPVEIDVLANDLLCNDSSSVMVELTTVQDPFYTGQQPPYFGTAKVLNNKNILYTPGSDFTGSDKFVYRIYRKEKDNGTPIYYYAMVHFGPVDCPNTMVLKDDSFTFKISAIQQMASVVLPVNSNDSFCTEAANDFSISFDNFPKGGASFDNDYNIIYTPPAGLQPGDTDIFTYRLCMDEKCKAATVTITFQ